MISLPLTLYSGPTPPDLACLPAELKVFNQWVLWRGVDKVDRKTGKLRLNKIPVDPQTLRNARTTDPTTWGTFARCVEALPVALEQWEQDNPATYRGGGIGFVFTAADPYAGVDLDGCRDPHTGMIMPWAQTHIDALASYAEITPSTTGVHVLSKGALPQSGHKKGAIEMYSDGRFFTCTGWHLAGTPKTITAHQEALYEVHGRVFGPQVITHPDGEGVCFCPSCDYLATLLEDGRCPACGTKPMGLTQATAGAMGAPATVLSDTDVLEKARHDQQHGTKFLTLWFGDWGNYPSQSEADAALCVLLAVYTQDAGQIDRLFRCSMLMRDKWREKRGAQTYGERTIAQALQWQAENALQPTLLVHGVSASRNGVRNGTTPGPEPHDPYACPPLPKYAATNEHDAAGASRFLQAYIPFSATWAPRAYEGFHEAVALFILSTVAARRVRIQFGPRAIYPSLYMALTARTTLFSKTTTAEVGMTLLEEAGLGHLLADDDATPQAFLRSLTRYVPSNYKDLSEEDQKDIKLQLAFTAQRGWFYEEWGQHLEAMMQRNGFMASFRGILRRMDDHRPRYVYNTISRGRDIIVKPYLTLLANVTPADLQPFVKAGSSLWRDGYIARVAFVAPEADDAREDEFPEGSMTFPADLTKPLLAWHKRLGIPQAIVKPTTDAKGKPTGLYSVSVSPLPEKTYTLDPEVRKAYYNYDRAMTQLTRARQHEDLDGSYGRFPVKALRIAGLLGSLQDDNDSSTIKLPQWYRGQQIAEHWRRDLHRLMQRVQTTEPPSKLAVQEDRLLRLLQEKGPQTVSRLHVLTKWPRTEINTLCEDLVLAHVLTKEDSDRAVKYSLNGAAT